MKSRQVKLELRVRVKKISATLLMVLPHLIKFVGTELLIDNDMSTNGYVWCIDPNNIDIMEQFHVRELEIV